MSMPRSVDLWAAIRAFWEHSPKEVSFRKAAEPAGEKHGFEPPSKQRVAFVARSEHWERVAKTGDINRAALLLADRRSDPGANVVPQADLPKKGPGLKLVGGAPAAPSKVVASFIKKHRLGNAQSQPGPSSS